MERLIKDNDTNKLGEKRTINANADPEHDTTTTQHWPSTKEYINTTGGRLHTPLQVASWFGWEHIVELLVATGADPNIYGG
jgi:hypothetical protein